MSISNSMNITVHGIRIHKSQEKRSLPSALCSATKSRSRPDHKNTPAPAKLPRQNKCENYHVRKERDLLSIFRRPPRNKTRSSEITTRKFEYSIRMRQVNHKRLPRLRDTPLPQFGPPTGPKYINPDPPLPGISASDAQCFMLLPHSSSKALSNNLIMNFMT